MSEVFNIKPVNDGEDRIIMNDRNLVEIETYLHNQGRTTASEHTTRDEILEQIKTGVIKFNHELEQQSLVGKKGLFSDSVFEGDIPETNASAKGYLEKDLDQGVAKLVARLNSEFREFINEQRIDLSVLSNDISSHLSVEGFQDSYLAGKSVEFDEKGTLGEGNEELSNNSVLSSRVAKIIAENRKRIEEAAGGFES